jgi:hypothetical protein
MAPRKASTVKGPAKRSTKTTVEVANETPAIAPQTPHLNGDANGVAKNGIPTYDQIQLRAYELFLMRGGSHGNDWNDWFRAESELRSSKIE